MEIKHETALIIAVIVILLFLFSGFGSYGMMGFGNYGMMGGSYYGNGMNIFGIFGWIIMLLVIVALVLFITWLIKQLQNPKQRKK